MKIEEMNLNQLIDYTENIAVELSQRLDSIDVGEGVAFERLRRITGYLSTTIDRWNDAKASEEKDRVKHNVP